MQSIGEMATLIPTAGTFPHFATRFISPSVGFALGEPASFWAYLPSSLPASRHSAISYYYCYAISVASELSAAAVLVSYWDENLTPAVTITVGLVVMVALNFVGVRWFGESEVVFSIIKILLFVGLIIVGLVIDLGGAPSGDRIGFRYWRQVSGRMEKGWVPPLR